MKKIIFVLMFLILAFNSKSQISIKMVVNDTVHYKGVDFINTFYIVTESTIFQFNGNSDIASYACYLSKTGYENGKSNIVEFYEFYKPSILDEALGTEMTDMINAIRSIIKQDFVKKFPEVDINLIVND
jgi:DNA replication protein DnaD